MRITAVSRALATFLLLATALPLAADTVETRIVSLDAATTETLFALGLGDQLVGRDDSSIYPEAANKVATIGTGHQINAEAVLAMKPSLIVGRGRAMSNPSIDLLEQAGAKVLRLPDTHGVDGARERIRALGKVLAADDKAEVLIASMDADLKQVEARKATLAGKPGPRVLIIYLRPGVTMLMGDDSAAAAMVQLTGAPLALAGLAGYKEMNAEAVVAAKPDVILCYREGLESVGGAEKLWDRPGLAQTPAGANKRLIAMDDLLLAGFGPRTGKAALELLDALYPEAAAEPAKP